ncbi:MAG: AMP-binding protein [Geminicoccaceae bacterium]
MDISAWIDRHAGFDEKRPAIFFEGRWSSYGEFRERILATARFLKHERGVSRGDRVAFLGFNHPDMLALLFACARLGAMLVPLNWRLAERELAFVLADSGARVLMHTDGYAEMAAALARPGLAVDALAAIGAEEGGASLDDSNPHVDLTCPLLLVYTSGTTGRPKGAVLRQDTIFWNALNSRHMHDLCARDRVLTVLPMFHVGGLNIQTLPALYVGGSVILHDRFDADAAFDAMERLQPTLTVQVPATMQALIGHARWAGADLSCFRMIACGSSVIPERLLAAFIERGIPPVQVYGSTETGPVAVYQTPDDAMRKPGSAGKAALHCEMRIVDEQGRDVAKGAAGEVWLRGGNVMWEYWRHEEATREALVEGWFRTGDIGRLDEEGDLRIVDRAKDLVISGGENIYPAEIELVLQESPFIREAAVVGRVDPRWGEVPVAFIVAEKDGLGEEAVRDHLRASLASFKHPKEIYFIDSMPRNVMGKLQKFLLRQRVNQ